MASTKIQSFDGNVGIGTNDPGSYALDVYTGSSTLEAVEATSLTVNGVQNSLLPVGSIVLWNTATPPSGWQICNGTGGTPDLRDYFIVGSESTYNQNQTGGNSTLTMSTANMHTHSHNLTTSSTGGHTHNSSSSNASHTHTRNANTSGGGGTHTHNANKSGSSNMSHSHPALNTGSGGNQHTHNTGTNTDSHYHYQQIAMDSNISAYNRSDGDYRNSVGRVNRSFTDADPAPRISAFSGHFADHNHTNWNTFNQSGNHTHNLAVGQANHTHNNFTANVNSHTHDVDVSYDNTTHTHTKPTIPASGGHTHTYTTDNAGSDTAFSILPSYYALYYIIKLS